MPKPVQEPEAQTFEEAMAEHDEEWQEAQDAAGQYKELGDGDYQARTVETRVEQSDWGEWQLYLKFQDVNGGGSVRVWDSLDQEVGRSIAAEHAKALGYEGPLSGLKAAVEAGELVDLICDIRVRTKAGEKRDFKQVYVNRTYGKAAETDVPPPPQRASSADDDIPF